jgi:adenylate cyclase
MKNLNEIERKFLVDINVLNLSTIKKTMHITQGYLLRADNGSARVRVERRTVDENVDEKAWLVIKQKIDDMSNNEIVCDLSIEEAFRLLENNCTQPLISKKRHIVKYGNVKWEIDEFFGHKSGLVMAEVELQTLSEEEVKSLVLPEWILKEVTGEAEYYNVNM